VSIFKGQLWSSVGVVAVPFRYYWVWFEMDMDSTQSSTQGSTQATQAGDPARHGPNSYIICGVKVEFPTKAYPCQIAMMSKVSVSLVQLIKIEWL